MKIGLILPSRGLVNSRTAETALELVTALMPEDTVIWYFSHNRPIPDCFNVPVEEALKDKCDWILILEEDVVFGNKELNALVRDAKKYKVAALDYKIGPDLMCAQVRGGIQLTGTGAIMISKDVLEAVGKPYFRTSVKYHALNMTEYEGMENVYGGQDIDFCVRAYRAGFPVHLVEGFTASHYKVKEYGEPQVNNGVHVIERIV